MITLTSKKLEPWIIRPDHMDSDLAPENIGIESFQFRWLIIFINLRSIEYIWLNMFIFLEKVSMVHYIFHFSTNPNSTSTQIFPYSIELVMTKKSNISSCLLYPLVFYHHITYTSKILFHLPFQLYSLQQSKYRECLNPWS